MSELTPPLLSVVTNRDAAGGIGPLLEALDAALATGAVDIVQMREKDLPDAEQFTLARRLRDLTKGRALFFVNDSASIAEAVHADGVHLGEASRPVAAVRQQRPGLLVGRSVHDTEAARQAEADGAHLIQAGAMFATLTHPGEPPAGAGLVRAAAGAVSAPVLAVGGVTAANVSEAVEAGASGAAVIRAVLAADDPGQAALALRQALEAAWSSRPGETA
ncbi:MAG: thiamine phosphate synthase [Chloroflexota bacterium]|nr:thiamine phosphate synthase [Chloroflexota bacterium]